MIWRSCVAQCLLATWSLLFRPSVCAEVQGGGAGIARLFRREAVADDRRPASRHRLTLSADMGLPRAELDATPGLDNGDRLRRVSPDSSLAAMRVEHHGVLVPPHLQPALARSLPTPVEMPPLVLTQLAGAITTKAGTPSPTTLRPTPMPTAMRPTMVPTPEPTALPSPLPTPEPTAVPSPILTLEPAVLPSPLPTPKPTAFPTPAQTPMSTSTPSPWPTPKPAAVPTPTEILQPTYNLIWHASVAANNGDELAMSLPVEVTRCEGCGPRPGECLGSCGGPGFCSQCNSVGGGQAGACCRYLNRDDPEECGYVLFLQKSYYECALVPPTPALASWLAPTPVSTNRTALSTPTPTPGLPQSAGSSSAVELVGIWNMSYENGMHDVYKFDRSGLAQLQSNSKTSRVMSALSVNDTVQDVNYAGVYFLKDTFGQSVWEYMWITEDGRLHTDLFADKTPCNRTSAFHSPHFCTSGRGEKVAAAV
mmetsp:Transcript_112687/g.318419  ORF Transcript_112687/g.318419 Transcript_112687/m.318419 type:complete len:480 (-) Transcript_112687:281-1720(-)